MDTSGTPGPDADELLRQRMEQLRARRAEGSPPPPSPGRDRGPGPARRRHPARGARAGALVLTLASTGGLGALFAHLNAGQADQQALAQLPAALPVSTPSAAPSSTGGTTPSTTAPSSTAPSSTTSSSSTTTTTPEVVDGTLVDTRYGPVQVQAQFKGGTLSEVAVVHYPDGDGESVNINARALPQLRREALKAQSADVQTVSGATYTSSGYQQSLQSAIDQVRAATTAAAP